MQTGAAQEPPTRLLLEVADGGTGGFTVDDGLWVTGVRRGTHGEQCRTLKNPPSMSFKVSHGRWS